MWVFFLKSKDEVFEEFKDWKTMIEKQTGRQVKRLRTDNGLEFVEKEFTKFCKKLGIVRHRTCVGRPQQNGVAERMNRTLLEKARCMFVVPSGIKQEVLGRSGENGGSCGKPVTTYRSWVEDGGGYVVGFAGGFFRIEGLRLPGLCLCERREVGAKSKEVYLLRIHGWGQGL